MQTHKHPSWQWDGKFFNIHIHDSYTLVRALWEKQPLVSYSVGVKLRPVDQIWPTASVFLAREASRNHEPVGMMPHMRCQKSQNSLLVFWHVSQDKRFIVYSVIYHISMYTLIYDLVKFK